MSATPDESNVPDPVTVDSTAPKVGALFEIQATVLWDGLSIEEVEDKFWDAVNAAGCEGGSSTTCKVPEEEL